MLHGRTDQIAYGMGAAIAGAVHAAIGGRDAITRLPITPCRLHAPLAAGAL